MNDLAREVVNNMTKSRLEPGESLTTTLNV
jgi:hypothetical protein